MEYYITEFQQYIKQLCIRHRDILHDDQTNVAFVRFMSGDDINQLTNQGAPVLVMVARYYGRSAGPSQDELKMKQFVQLRFACAAVHDAVIDYSDQIATATDKAFSIMAHFLVKFQNDSWQDDCGPLRGMEIENATWNELPEQPYLVNFYGWDLFIPFTSEFPAYDATIWGE